MATWITHLMVADNVLAACPWLDRRGFCVGNIAPDCNVENEDWSAFTPPREITHWMTGERKVAADCERFYETYIVRRRSDIRSPEELSFLLGYYAHLVTDAAYQRMIRDPQRVADACRRVMAAPIWRSRGEATDWDALKRVMPKQARMREIDALEAEYLRDHPDSGYLTEIVPLRDFPDYIDYLPHGCIVRKIGVMGTIPAMDETLCEPLSISRAELSDFVQQTADGLCRVLEERRGEIPFAK